MSTSLLCHVNYHVCRKSIRRNKKIIWPISLAMNFPLPSALHSSHSLLNLLQLPFSLPLPQPLAFLLLISPNGSSDRRPHHTAILFLFSFTQTVLCCLVLSVSGRPSFEAPPSMPNSRIPIQSNLGHRSNNRRPRSHTSSASLRLLACENGTPIQPKILGGERLRIFAFQGVPWGLSQLAFATLSYEHYQRAR